jgi:RNAse (barnase) inhibitor barstar
MNTGIRNIDSIKIVTRVASVCHDVRMIRIADLKERLDQQYDADYDCLQENYAEQNKLRPAVLRFHDLEREAKAHEERAARIIAVLGEEKFKDKELNRRGAAKDIFFDTENLPLWALMQAIVEQVTEIQVVDLQETLAFFKKKASRQAIESALASHKDVFVTRTRGREKFVSLKR